MMRWQRLMAIVMAVVVVLAISFGCSQASRQTGAVMTGKAAAERSVNAVLWMQTAGEVRALSYQAFALARMRLDWELDKRAAAAAAGGGPSGKRLAVVVDVDETVLDNTPYQARAIVTGETYPMGWAEWIDRAEAKALPGAVEFLRYAESKGVSVFYITNRKQRGRSATLANLKRAGFPVNPKHVMLRIEDRSKVSRRERVLRDHQIVMLLGDNLGDFHQAFEIENLAARNRAVDRMREEFGRRFIVLPNPIYGDWEGSIYRGDFRRPESEKAQLRQNSLHYY